MTGQTGNCLNAVAPATNATTISDTRDTVSPEYMCLRPIIAEKENAIRKTAKPASVSPTTTVDNKGFYSKTKSVPHSSSSRVQFRVPSVSWVTAIVHIDSSRQLAFRALDGRSGRRTQRVRIGSAVA